MSRVLAEAVEHGALGVALSGAGPTLLAFVERDSAQRVELADFLLHTLAEAGVEATLMWLKPALQGAQKLTPYDENSTLFANIQHEVRT
jgi:homoserine kinase